MNADISAIARFVNAEPDLERRAELDARMWWASWCMWWASWCSLWAHVAMSEAVRASLPPMSDEQFRRCYYPTADELGLRPVPVREIGIDLSSYRIVNG